MGGLGADRTAQGLQCQERGLTSILQEMKATLRPVPSGGC